MTSKVQQVKEAQGYTKASACCKECMAFRSDRMQIPGALSWHMPRYAEKNKRCDIGGFAVQSSASCNFFKRKEPA